jgi:hypothetical protein
MQKAGGVVFDEFAFRDEASKKAYIASIQRPVVTIPAQTHISTDKQTLGPSDLVANQYNPPCGYYAKCVDLTVMLPPTTGNVATNVISIDFTVDGVNDDQQFRSAKSDTDLGWAIIGDPQTTYQSPSHGYQQVVVKAQFKNWHAQGGRTAQMSVTWEYISPGEQAEKS